MALNGKYEFVKDEGQLEHLLATGVPEDRAKEIIAESKVLEITINGSSLAISRGKRLQNLTIGQEVTETTPDGGSVKNKATLDGNVLSISSTTGKGGFKRIYSLSGSELTVTTSSAKDGVPNGKRIYKKL